MATRCTLCRRLVDRSQDADCRCGWCLDPNCARNHREFCPTDGQDKWIGAVEI